MRGSPITSSPTRELAARRSGFFIRHLPEAMLGRPPAPNFPASALGAAARWLNPLLFSTPMIDALRESFAAGGRVPHVCVDDVIEVNAARAINAALCRAAGQELELFLAWLETDDAAAFHFWLAGRTPIQDRIRRRVEISRMQSGDDLPCRVDREDLTAVYSFTDPGWQPAHGGQIYFPSTKGDGVEIIVEPRFNSVFLFAPSGAAHGVARIEGTALSRLTVTAGWSVAAPASAQLGRR